ncbi:MAG: DUF4292 domain-containing protein [Mediterranea sp.]|nr:DUF4292 domain-containing protein [Mediterranea sp.]
MIDLRKYTKIDLRRYTKVAFAALLSALLLVSCKSVKTAVQGGNAMRADSEELLEAVIRNTPAFDSFSSQLRLTIPLKKGEYTLNGTLKMQRDQLIRISLLLPIIRTEAARIEISPENILVIDRMNKRYVSVPLSGLRELLHTEVDFPMLQSFFSNAIFQPGKYHLTRKDYSSFQVRSHGDNNMQLLGNSHEFVYSFLASIETGRLLSSSIEPHSSSFRLQWEYTGFVPVGQTMFPSEMTVIAGNKNDPGRTILELSRLSVDEQTLTPTSIPPRYEQIRLSDVLKMLEDL